MLSRRFVSVRNILRLWHTVIWNGFPLAVFQHYWDLVINTSLRKCCFAPGWTQLGNGSGKLSELKTTTAETGIYGGVGKSGEWWAGTYWDVIAPKAPKLSNCRLRYHGVARYWGAACCFLYWCTASLENAISPGGKELRIHLKQWEKYKYAWRDGPATHRGPPWTVRGHQTLMEDICMLCSYIFSEVTLILSQLGVLFSLFVCTEKKVVCLLQFPRNLLN